MTYTTLSKGNGAITSDVILLNDVRNAVVCFYCYRRVS